MGRHGENIRKRADGRWEARVIDGRKPDGRAHYRCLYGKSYREVKQKKLRLVTELEQAEASIAQRANQKGIAFSELAKEWLSDKKGTIKESSLNHYRYLLEKHLLPEWRDRLLSEITADLLDDFLRKKQKGGRLDGSGGLSPKYVTDIRCVLASLIRYAHSHGYLCAVSRRLFCPKQERPEIRVLSREEQTRLDRYLSEHPEPFTLGVRLVLYSGLRIGEVCALKWKDVHLESGKMTVRHTLQRMRDPSPGKHRTRIVIGPPKTAASKRTIPIPSFILEYLSSFQCDPDNYILTGLPKFIEPRYCLMKFKKILSAAGIGDHNFHALRHTFATRCVESDFDAKSLSEILGHSNVATTMQLYVHPTMSSKREQMERLSRFSIHGQKNSQKQTETKKIQGLGARAS